MGSWREPLSRMTWHGPHRSCMFTLPSGRQDLSRGAWVNPIPPPSWVNHVPPSGSGRPSQDLTEAAGNTAGGRGAARVPGRGLQAGGWDGCQILHLTNCYHFWGGCCTTWLRKQRLWGAVGFLPTLMSTSNISCTEWSWHAKCLILPSPHSLLQRLACLLSPSRTEFRDKWSAGVGMSSLKTIQVD